MRLSGATFVVIAGNGSDGFSGDGGSALGAALSQPYGLAADPSGTIYVADTTNNRIRLLTPPALMITGPPSLVSGSVGINYPGATFSAFGGTGVYSWSASGLPTPTEPTG